MFLAEPQRTPYDLHFPIAGIDVRVTPFFWVVAALLGWDLAAWLGTADSSPGQAVLLLFWIAAVFVSILVHELGHALAMRYYGMSTYIVLYHFGGLAASDAGSSFIRSGRFAKPNNQIVISAAGPAAQLLLAASIIGVVRLSGYSLLLPVPFLDQFLPAPPGEPIPSFALNAFATFLMLPSVLWALLNLLPVYPLDGGQIAREILSIFSPRDGVRNSLILSVVAGAGVAIYAFTTRNLFLAIMFAMLAFSSYQILQAYHGRGGGSW